MHGECRIEGNRSTLKREIEGSCRGRRMSVNDKREERKERNSRNEPERRHKLEK